MPVKNPKRLVVDSDIVHAASDRPGARRPAPRCRDFLEEIRALGHAVVITRAIQSEWRTHLRSYARDWFDLMERRRLIVRTLVREDEDLRAALSTMAANDGERAAMLKDCHLLEAALATDRIIASLERVARGRFRRAAPLVREIREIVWVDPEREEEAAIIWLRRGAPAEKHRMLGYRGEER